MRTPRTDRPPARQVRDRRSRRCGTMDSMSGAPAGRPSSPASTSPSPASGGSPIETASCRSPTRNRFCSAMRADPGVQQVGARRQEGPCVPRPRSRTAGWRFRVRFPGRRSGSASTPATPGAAGRRGTHAAPPRQPSRCSVVVTSLRAPEVCRAPPRVPRSVDLPRALLVPRFNLWLAFWTRDVYVRRSCSRLGRVLPGRSYVERVALERLRSRRSPTPSGKKRPPGRQPVGARSDPPAARELISTGLSLTAIRTARS